MAYGNPSGGGEDLYTDGGGQPPMDKGNEPDEKEGEGMGETTLIPESMLMGKKFEIGEEVVFKVVGKHDGQVQISYSTEPADDTNEAPEQPGEPMGGGEGATPTPPAAGGGMYD